MKNRLDIQEEFSDIRKRYAEDPRNTTFNGLIYGHPGTGKTNSLRTARKPILVHSFDPGGTETISDEIEKGNILADTRFEQDDPNNPTAFNLWEEEFERLKAGGFFPHIGTFVIDSITSWCDALMNEIHRREGRIGKSPRLRDYQIQIKTARDYMKEMTTLPCDFIAIGHIETDKDEVTGEIKSVLMVTGKLKTKLPLLFSEVYVADTKETSKGINYFFHTQNNGIYKARSRFDKEGNNIEPKMPQDYKNILQEAGYDVSDKELPSGNSS